MDMNHTVPGYGDISVLGVLPSGEEHGDIMDEGGLKKSRKAVAGYVSAMILKTRTPVTYIYPEGVIGRS